MVVAWHSLTQRGYLECEVKICSLFSAFPSLHGNASERRDSQTFSLKSEGKSSPALLFGKALRP